MTLGELRTIDLTATQTILLAIVVVVGIIALVGIIAWDMLRDRYDD